LFVVRLWLEGGDGSAEQWRGLVEHVPSGLRLYFTVLNELNDFIALRSGPPAIAQQRTDSWQIVNRGGLSHDQEMP
jgi:hypothetical protein